MEIYRTTTPPPSSLLKELWNFLWLQLKILHLVIVLERKARKVSLNANFFMGRNSSKQTRFECLDLKRFSNKISFKIIAISFQMNSCCFYYPFAIYPCCSLRFLCFVCERILNLYPLFFHMRGFSPSPRVVIISNGKIEIRLNAATDYGCEFH